MKCGCVERSVCALPSLQREMRRCAAPTMPVRNAWTGWDACASRHVSRLCNTLVVPYSTTLLFRPTVQHSGGLHNKSQNIASPEVVCTNFLHLYRIAASCGFSHRLTVSQTSTETSLLLRFQPASQPASQRTSQLDVPPLPVLADLPGSVLLRGPAPPAG